MRRADRFTDHAPQREANRVLGGEVLHSAVCKARLPEPLHLKTPASADWRASWVETAGENEQGTQRRTRFGLFTSAVTHVAPASACRGRGGGSQHDGRDTAARFIQPACILSLATHARYPAAGTQGRRRVASGSMHLVAHAVRWATRSGRVRRMSAYTARTRRRLACSA